MASLCATRTCRKCARVGEAGGGGESHGISALETALTLYTFPFFSTPTLKENVRTYAATHGLPYARVFRSAEDRDEDVMRSLLHRVPVFFGGSTEGGLWHDHHALRRLLGVAEATPLPNPEPVRVTISGMAPVFPAREVRVRGLMGTVHTYGLAFEGKESPDLVRFAGSGAVARKGGKYEISDAHALRHEMKKMYASVFAGAVDLCRRAGRSRGVVRVPLLGLGAFSKALTAASQQTLAELYAEALLSQCCAYLGRLEVEVFILERDLQSNPAARKFRDVLAEAPCEGVVSCRVESLFNVTGVAFPERADGYVTDRGRLLVMVNAWDGSSFIGNGGAKDFTIDGFFVAAAGGEKVNAHLQNGSYLLNPWLNRGLLRPEAWEVARVAEA